MEEEDKKAELNSEIWKKHQKKEAKNLKKIFKIIFFISCIDLHSEISYGVCLSKKDTAFVF